MPASYEIVVHSLKGTVPFQNSFIYLTNAPDASYAEALDLAQQFVGTAPLGDYLACLPTDVVMQGVTCRSIIADGGSATATPTVVIPNADTGGRAPAATTGQTSNQNGPMMSWFPALEPGERARVCKTFFPTVNESDAEDDAIGAGLLTAIDSFRATLVAGLALTSTTAVWVARIWKLVEVDPGVFAKVPFIRSIVKSITEFFVASQRRRRPKVF
jgi:hypothetical protein